MIKQLKQPVRILPTVAILKQRRRKLIKCATPAERLFRSRLNALGIQYKFQCIAGFYIADFALISNSVIVELDGEIHNSQKEYDSRRDKFLTACGFKVVRIPNDQATSYPLDMIDSLSGTQPFNICLGTANSKHGAVIARNLKTEAKSNSTYTKRPRQLRKRQIVAMRLDSLLTENVALRGENARLRELLKEYELRDEFNVIDNAAMMQLRA